jgi:hypothetical protein
MRLKNSSGNPQNRKSDSKDAETSSAGQKCDSSILSDQGQKAKKNKLSLLVATCHPEFI